MRISLLTAISSITLLGVGCTPVQPPLDLSAQPPGTEAEVSLPSAAQPSVAVGEQSPAGTEAEVTVPAAAQPPVVSAPVSKPFYISYSAEQYARARAAGQPILLYFWASWCPICRAEEPKIKATVEAGSSVIAGFRVNYDVEKSLEKQFGVTYQHTTVILDSKGRESARFTGPVAEGDLSAAIAAAAAK